MKKQKRWTKKDLEELMNRQINSLNINPQTSLFSSPDDSNNLYEKLITLKNNNQAIFLPGNIPSSKNSRKIVQVPTKQSICCGAGLIILQGNYFKCSSCDKPTRRKFYPSLVFSDTVNKYITRTIHIYIDKKHLFRQLCPSGLNITLGLYFIRDSKHHFDYHNAQQIIGDMMRQYGWIRDDCSDVIKFIPLGYHVKKEHAGVIMVNLPDFDSFILALLDTY